MCEVSSLDIRRLGYRRDRNLAIGVAAVLGLTAVFMVLWQLGTETMSSKLGQQRVDAMSSRTRDLSLNVQGWFTTDATGRGEPASSFNSRPDAFTDPIEWQRFLPELSAEIARVDAALPNQLRNIVEQPQFRVTGKELPLNTVHDSDVRFPAIIPSFAQGLEAEILLSEGSYPQPTAIDSAVQVLLSKEAADALDWKVGEQRSTILVPEQPLELVGVFEPRNPEAGYWEHATASSQPRVVDDLNAGRSVTAAAYLAPGTQFAVPGAQQAQVWFPIAHLDSMDLTELNNALRQVTTASEFKILETPLSTELTAELEQTVADANAVSQLASYVRVIPMLVLAASLIGALGALHTRNSQLLHLSFARGATKLQRVWWGVSRIARVAVPTQLLAVAIACAFFPQSVVESNLTSIAISQAAFALIVLGATALVWSSNSVEAARNSNEEVRRKWEWTTTLVSAGALLVIIAVKATGLAEGDTWLDMIVPFAVVIVGATLTLSCAQFALRALAARWSHAGSVTTFVGLAQVSRSTRTVSSMLLVTVIMTALTVFACGTWITISQGVSQGVEQKVGADIKLSGPVFDQEKVSHISEIAQVENTASVMELSPASLHVGYNKEAVRLYVADAANLQQLSAYGWLQDLPLDKDNGTALPQTSSEPEETDAPAANPQQSAMSPQPAVVAPDLADQLSEAPDHLLVTVFGQFTLDVVSTHTALPGVNSDSRFVLASHRILQEPADFKPKIVLVDLKPGVDSRSQVEVEALLSSMFPYAKIESRADALVHKKSDVALVWLKAGLAICVAVTLGASLSALAITAAAGRRTELERERVLLSQGGTQAAARRVKRARTLGWVVPAVSGGLMTGTALGLTALSTADLTNVLGIAEVDPLSSMLVSVLICAVLATSVAMVLNILSNREIGGR